MSKTTAPAFPLYGGDWLKGTNKLKAHERGHYLDILLNQWDSQEPFPTDEEDQMRIARSTDKREWRQVWHRLRGKFVETPDGFWNRRVEDERIKLRNSRERKSKAGRSGADQRWHLNGENAGSAIAEPMAQPLPTLPAEAMTKGWPSISHSQRDPPKEREDLSPAPTRQLLTLFDELHQRRFETPAEINGAKDGAILASLCRKRGLEETERLIRAFFDMRDTWVLQRGFSVGIFKTQISKLLAARPAAEPQRAERWYEQCERLAHEPRCADHLAHGVRLARDEQAAAQ